jgi:hypothetical protein
MFFLHKTSYVYKRFLQFLGSLEYQIDVLSIRHVGEQNDVIAAWSVKRIWILKSSTLGKTLYTPVHTRNTQHEHGFRQFRSTIAIVSVKQIDFTDYLTFIS